MPRMYDGKEQRSVIMQHLSETVSNERQPDAVEQPEIKECKDSAHICGKEAACHTFENNTSKCMCPHDLTPPTPDLRCPNRITVPITPHPIHNIIPPSGKNGTNSTNALPEAEQVEGLKYKVPEIIGVTVTFVTIIILLLSIIYGVRRRSYNVKSQRSPLNGTPINLKKGLLLAHKYTSNPQYFTCTSPGVPIIQRESLIFLHDIGEGCFGKVYKGEWHDGNAKEIVAIKVLKDTATLETEQDFMREVDIMSTFSHANILSLKGMVLRDATNNPWMVFEYMPYGDLAEVLRANSLQFRTSKSGLQPLTKESLYWITIQVAAGMTYLSAQRFVHRDLACRNCLVGVDLTVKIADFGMSRDIYTCDYYKIGGSRLLPVRWMSPESVVYGRFTLETDIWSYGVVLWEIYSYGKQPYYGFSNEEVVKLILQGTMLVPPDECPPVICEIMQDCWKVEPRERIKFPDILDRLEKVQTVELAQQGTLPRPPQGPVLLRTPDVLDPDGYLLPAPAIPREYLQTLPALSD
ncbi:hypothetical protein PUN28_009344 [Cardiocondyla obscurior]|uniref:Protein kinase domain-containing protein n=1 Tax=Cardiocondyla obscurior TaxID=286306 RepID=A0AAW2FXE2_9HYME